MQLASPQVLRNRKLAIPVIWGLIYLTIASLGLRHYINWTSPVFLMGVLCLFQLLIPGHSNTPSLRFAYAAMALGLLSFFLPVKTTLYLSGAAALLFLLEAVYGKIRQAAMFTLLIMSPVFSYAVSVFSFPIRLQLTSWAGSLIAFSGQNMSTEGNMLIINGNEFIVDPECMGLNMMETSLLLGIMISHFYQKKFGVKIRLVPLVLILVVISCLNIVSNLFRIIALVQFNIQPETVMHEVIGLACLLVYVILPGAVLIKLIIQKRVKVPALGATAPQPGRSSVPAWLCFLVMVSVTVASFNTIRHEKEKHTFSPASQVSPGYTSKRLATDILQLNGSASLVYIKKIRSFYSTEHNPTICWKGSGYTFRKVTRSNIRGSEVYIAVLARGNEELYTAWWYDNGNARTIGQFKWRSDVFRGSRDYSLVNVTCSGYTELYKTISDIFESGNLNRFL